MSKYCLPKNLADKFKKHLKSGDINAIKLSLMSSADRKKHLSKFVGGDNAKNINTLFEQRLLAKNKVNAMVSWAKEVTGMKKEARTDLVSKIEKMTQEEEVKLLNPKNEKMFLEDLVSHKLGVNVSFKETKQITKLSNKITKNKLALNKKNNTKNRIALGNSMLDANDYIDSLKPTMGYLDQVANVANMPKAVMSTMDYSAPFRQGFGMVRRKEFWNNFVPMFKASFSKNYYRDIQADIITRDNYDLMQKSGLRLTGLGDNLSQREEAFMTNLLDKVPGIKHSERAYTGFLTKLRADVFDDLVKKAELNGEDMGIRSKATKDIANVVNNFTGAGKLGRIDNAAPVLNTMFFSPRKIRASLAMLNPKTYLDPRISPTARKESIKNLIGMVTASSTLLGLGKLAGFDVENDIRSADFGKIKIGDTRIDVTGGNGTYLVLLARLISNKTKSSISGIVQELGEGYGTDTRGDIGIRFFRNKLSPTVSYFTDWAWGKSSIGKPFKAGKSALDRVTPMAVGDAIELGMENPKIAPYVGLANIFGFGSMTYNNEVDWNEKTTKEMIQAKERLGQEQFDKANGEYNKEFDKRVKEVLDDQSYKDLSEESKAKTITRLRKNIKADIFKSYYFKYKVEENKDIRTIQKLTK